MHYFISWGSFPPDSLTSSEVAAPSDVLVRWLPCLVVPYPFAFCSSVISSFSSAMVCTGPKVIYEIQRKVPESPIQSIPRNSLPADHNLLLCQDHPFLIPLKGAFSTSFLTNLTTSKIADLTSLAVFPSSLTITPLLSGRIDAPPEIAPVVIVSIC